MRTLFLDTEFNGHGGELLSMAFVGEDSEWYAALPNPENPNPWVAARVIPKLGSHRLSKEEFREELHKYLLLYSYGDGVRIVADSYADFLYLFQQFAGPTYAESLNIPCVCELVAAPSGYNPSAPHNALSDAKELWNLLRDNYPAPLPPGRRAP